MQQCVVQAVEAGFPATILPVLLELLGVNDQGRELGRAIAIVVGILNEHPLEDTIKELHGHLNVVVDSKAVCVVGDDRSGELDWLLGLLKLLVIR